MTSQRPATGFHEAAKEPQQECSSNLRKHSKTTKNLDGELVKILNTWVKEPTNMFPTKDITAPNILGVGV